MSDEEREEAVAKIHRTFAFRAFRAVAFLMAALVVLNWTVPDLRGPVLTLTLVGVPLVIWLLDTLLERI